MGRKNNSQEAVLGARNKVASWSSEYSWLLARRAVFLL